MIVLGIDPGLATCGLAAVDLQPPSLAKRPDVLVRAWVVRTEKSARKLDVRAADDHSRRARELAAEVATAIGIHRPLAVAIEAPSWPRNAATAAKIGIAFGAIYALAQEHRLPLVQASPQDIKRAVTGSKTASKDEVIAAIEARFPDIEWPTQTTLWEHAADAVGAVVANLDADVLRMVRLAGSGVA